MDLNFCDDSAAVQLQRSWQTLITEDYFKGTSSKLDVSDFPKGIYFLKVIANKEHYSVKFIKQ